MRRVPIIEQEYKTLGALSTGQTVNSIYFSVREHQQEDSQEYELQCWLGKFTPESGTEGQPGYQERSHIRYLESVRTTTINSAQARWLAKTLSKNEINAVIAEGGDIAAAIEAKINSNYNIGTRAVKNAYSTELD